MQAFGACDGKEATPCSLFSMIFCDDDAELHWFVYDDHATSDLDGDAAILLENKSDAW